MKEVQDIYSVLAELELIINNQTLQTEIQNLTRLRTSFQQTVTVRPVPNIQTQGAALTQINNSIDNIIVIVSGINTSLWNAEHENIIEKLGISDFIGENGRKHFENVKTQIQSNLTNPTFISSLIQSTIQELNSLRTKPVQFLNLLKTFDLKSNIEILDENEGIIEIVFDGNVAIDDFKEAKDQMQDWFLIIEGYARLLGVTREDFEIIGISKNSPTKFKIKTTLKNTALVISIITSVLLIEKTVLENKLMIEQLKHNNLVSDPEFQRSFIENAEKHIDDKIQAGINLIVEQKIDEYKIEKNNGDIEANLKKGIQNQYNFVVNGGTVNVQVIEGELKKEVVSLENTKEEIKRIRSAYENQKILTTGESSQEKNEIESGETETNE